MTASSIEVRKRLLGIVERFPGLHLREIARHAQLSEAHAAYHLDALADEGHVAARSEGGYRRFYGTEAPAPNEADREYMSLLRQRVPLQIVLLLVDQPGMTHQELTTRLGLAKSTVSYHLAKLDEAGIVSSHQPAGFVLRQPKRVEKLLLRWEPPADSIARFEALWRAFYGSRHKG